MATQNTGSAIGAPLLLIINSAQILGALAYQSLPDLTDSRCRWVPQNAIFEVLSLDVVLDFLRSGLYTTEEQQTDCFNVVTRICSQIDECECGQSRCTGGRIIFAALLSVSKPELIDAVFRTPNGMICDASLPQQVWPIDDTNYLLEVLNGTLSPGELDRFLHFTWQMRSPFVPEPASQDPDAVENEILDFSANASLPWVSLKNARDTDREDMVDMERSTIHKIAVHLAHHQVGKLDGDLALKTLDGYAAGWEFKHEVEANSRVPHHDRIVPLLSAFKHRGKFCLVFPWAHGGNLTTLLENYATPITTTAMGIQVTAGWYSEDWLLTECLGLAEALTAVHQHPKSAQIHADIKPENILCFASGDTDRGPFTLKLADFGQAQQVHQENGTISVERVPRTKTYRPPEHDTDGLIRLNYDVWCLGAVFLEFITWGIAGYRAVDDFSDARLGEIDDRTVSTARGTVLQDTFFKRASAGLRPGTLPRFTLGHQRKIIEDSGLARSDYRKRHRWWIEYNGSTRVKALRKEVVKNHISFLQDKCEGSRLHTFLDFIDSSMLVVDPVQRADSSAVCTFLKGLQRSAS